MIMEKKDIGWVFQSVLFFEEGMSEQEQSQLGIPLKNVILAKKIFEFLKTIEDARLKEDDFHFQRTVKEGRLA